MRWGGLTYKYSCALNEQLVFCLLDSHDQIRRQQVDLICVVAWMLMLRTDVVYKLE
jgi:hypothetical protein